MSLQIVVLQDAVLTSFIMKNKCAYSGMRINPGAIHFNTFPSNGSIIPRFLVYS